MKIENYCVGCETCTLGYGCPLLHVETYYCDLCDCGEVEYRVDDLDLCQDCANKYLNDMFNECTMEEKAEMLGVNYKQIV